MVALGEGVFPGVVYIIGSSLWTLEACYSLWCAKDVSYCWHGEGVQIFGVGFGRGRGWGR